MNGSEESYVQCAKRVKRYRAYAACGTWNGSGSIGSTSSRVTNRIYRAQPRVAMTKIEKDMTSIDWLIGEKH